MENKYHPVATPTAMAALSLDGVWEVYADVEYKVRREPTRRSLLVLVRTLAGAGEIVDDAGRVYALTPGSLFCIEEDAVRFYQTTRADWVFWWFLMPPPASALPVPLRRVLRVSIQPEEESEMQRVAELIGQQRYAQRAYGIARFNGLVHQWLAAWRGARRRGVYDDRIEVLIAKLRESPGGDWPLDRMARCCHLGERRFRDVFRAVTGSPPKRFLDRIRMEQGRELLRMGLCNVGEAAARLGYSSPFHFSRAYRRFFGEPPSASMFGE